MFGSNKGKHELEKTLYLDTFHAVNMSDNQALFCFVFIISRVPSLDTLF